MQFITVHSQSSCGVVVRQVITSDRLRVNHSITGLSISTKSYNSIILNMMLLQLLFTMKRWTRRRWDNRIFMTQ